MKIQHDYTNDSIYVTTKEIKEGLVEGMTKKLQMECFDISSQTYDKLKKGIIPHAKIGKHNGVVDIDEEMNERKQGLHKCNYPISKCTCEAKEQ